MRPAVSAFSLWVPLQIKNLYIALPNRFTMKHFMDRHGFMPDRAAVVQLLDGHLQPLYVVSFIRHNV